MTSQIFIFYNPITSSYYRPLAFHLDESRLPITKLPNSLRFYGGLTCGLLQNKTDPICERFPPGTSVSFQHKYSLAQVIDGVHRVFTLFSTW